MSRIQLDEVTDNNKDEYLIYYVWFTDGIDITEELLFFEGGVKKMLIIREP
jgi:hypothetical protein